MNSKAKQTYVDGMRSVKIDTRYSPRLSMSISGYSNSGLNTMHAQDLKKFRKRMKLTVHY